MIDKIKAAREQLGRDLALRDVLLSQVEKFSAEAAARKEAAGILDKTAMLLNTLGEERQMEAQSKIEELVTRGLQAIFEPDISLVISTSVKGKSTSTEFLIRTEGEKPFETSVMDARGGGLVAVTAFLLRVTVLLLTQPEGKRFLLIDESFAHLSKEYLHPVGMFLRELVDETGVQIVLITHQEELEEHASSTVRFTQVDGKTVIAG